MVSTKFLRVKVTRWPVGATICSLPSSVKIILRPFSSIPISFIGLYLRKDWLRIVIDEISSGVSSLERHRAINPRVRRYYVRAEPRDAAAHISPPFKPMDSFRDFFAAQSVGSHVVQLKKRRRLSFPLSPLRSACFVPNQQSVAGFR